MTKTIRTKKVFVLILSPILCFFVAGCMATTPKKLFTVSESNLKMRQLEMRKFNTTNEQEVLSACAGALQDMGFTIDDSETKLGLISASKNREAYDAAQVAMATAAVVLAAMARTYSNAFDYIDKEQKIRASVVTRPSVEGNDIVVRVTFQRIVWNNVGNVSRMETLGAPKLYEGFFDKISKAIFLEGQEI